MNLAFWKSYATRPVVLANQQLMAAIASIDPKGYDEANIDAKEAQLVDLGKKIEGYKRQHDEAKAAYNAAERLNSQRMASIEILQKQAETATGPEKAKLDAAINSQLGTVAESQSELDNLKEAEKTALELFSAFDSTYQSKVSGFKSRRHELEQARRQYDLAGSRNDMAREKQKAAGILAGIKTEGADPIDTAVAAMKKKTDAINDDTASRNRLAGSLTPVDDEKSNSLIADAMAQASGMPAASMDPKDRLEALKAQQAKRAA